MSNAENVVRRYHELLGLGDLQGWLGMYSDDAEIVRYDGVARNRDEFERYFTEHLGRHPGYQLRQIDRIREADDVLMWDALVETEHGVAQFFHVVIRDDDGRFHRHVPGMRGYWGG
jgi:ketosteroid isomerase-like protein